MTQLPEGFLDYISQYPQLSILARTLTSGPEVSIRINPAKKPVKGQSPVIDGALQSEKVPWCELGFYLTERPQFTFDPALHQGLYYVQDASSMAIYSVVKELAKSPVRYLDACAAPGGKTTAAIAALPAGSLVVANEYDYKRAEILAENIAKWGAPNVVVSRGDTKKLAKLKNFFDIVAVDAPCSGEGMMRKESVAVTQWTEGLVKECAATQRDILQNVWPSLRPGGYLIYSTCTFNIEENEKNLHWLIEQTEGIPTPVNSLDSYPQIINGINTEIPCYRFLPGNVKGEGLFIAVIQKPGILSAQSPKFKADKPLKEAAQIKKWLNCEVELIERNGEVYALPKPLAASMLPLTANLDCISIGVHVATIKGKDIIPTHELALSTIINSEAFPKAEITHDEAIKYLQREAVNLPDDAPKGYVLLTFDQIPLGFVKNLGKRANNLLPKQWRILSRK